MITLNNAIINLSNIATAHNQIKSFFFGEISDFGASGTINYPAMAVTSEISPFQENVLVMNFNIYISDLAEKDISNRPDLRSDTQQICLDIIAILDRDTRYEWNVDLASIALNPFVGTFDQEVTGWWFNLKLRVPNPLDRCQVPFDTTLVIKDGT